MGSATMSAPSLSLRFAISDTATITVAVIKYLVINQPIHAYYVKVLITVYRGSY
jgi:hypothetical protein